MYISKQINFLIRNWLKLKFLYQLKSNSTCTESLVTLNEGESTSTMKMKKMPDQRYVEEPRMPKKGIIWPNTQHGWWPP